MDQATCRRLVRSLADRAELSEFEERAAKSRERCARKYTNLVVASGTLSKTVAKRAELRDGDVQYRDVEDNIPVVLEGRKGAEDNYTSWRHWQGGLDRS